MPNIVVHGDTSSHGGTVAATATHVTVDGKLVVRVGDILTCPTHGPQVVTGHSTKLEAEGKMVARHGDAVACGASLISSTTTPDG